MEQRDITIQALEGRVTALKREIESRLHALEKAMTENETLAVAGEASSGFRRRDWSSIRE